MERNNKHIVLLCSTDKEVSETERKIDENIEVLDDYITKVAAIKASEITTFRNIESGPSIQSRSVGHSQTG